MTAAAGRTRPSSAPDSVHMASRNKIAAADGTQGRADITPGLDPLAHTRYMEVMVGPHNGNTSFSPDLAAARLSRCTREDRAKRRRRLAAAARGRNEAVNLT